MPYQKPMSDEKAQEICDERVRELQRGGTPSKPAPQVIVIDDPSAIVERRGPGGAK